MRRLGALTLALAAILMVGGPAAASAPFTKVTNDNEWLYYPVDGVNPQGWFHRDCNTANEVMHVVLFEHAWFEGARVHVCSAVEPDLCYVPLGGSHQGLGCPWIPSVANDAVSSIKVLSISYGRCVAFYRDTWYGGPSFKAWAGNWDGNIPGNVGNDAISSMRRLYAADC